MNLKLNPELIKTLDRLAPSPSELATKVYNILKQHHSDLTDYELLAFSIEFIGLMSMTEHSYLKPQTLTKDFYLAHYYNICEKIGASDLMTEDITKAGPLNTSEEDLPKK